MSLQNKPVDECHSFGRSQLFRRRVAWSVIGLALACLLAVMSVFGQRRSNLEGVLREGRRALIMGNFPAALQIARRAVDRAPDSDVAWRLLVDAAEREEAAEEAVGGLTRLAELD